MAPPKAGDQLSFELGPGKRDDLGPQALMIRLASKQEIEAATLKAAV